MTADPEASTWKPRLEKGMRTSTNHPSSVILVSASQWPGPRPYRGHSRLDVARCSFLPSKTPENSVMSPFAYTVNVIRLAFGAYLDLDLP